MYEAGGRSPLSWGAWPVIGWLPIGFAPGGGWRALTFSGDDWLVSLLGRGPELAVCRAALSGGRADAVAVVIAGPPGIGKTTMWRAVADSFSADALVLRTTGLPGAQAALASLADLLDPVAATVLAGLPPPQATALRVALGLAAPGTLLTGALPERAIVGALRGLARGGVVVALDDEQWVDGDTRRLLEIAAARLSGAPVRWLVAVRSGHADRGLVPVLEHELGPRLTRVDLAGLGDATLSELILTRFPGQWSPGLLRRVVTLAAGNPYTAVEVARETVASGGRDGPAARLPSALAESLRSRLARLTPQALAVVQAAALAGTPTRALLRALPAGQPTSRWMRRWTRTCCRPPRRTRCCGSATRCCARPPRGC